MRNATKLNGSKKAQIFLGLLVFGLGIAAMPAHAETDREKINRLENDIETLQRAVYRGETPPPGAGGGGSAVDAEVRIQGFESQIRELTNRVEEQDHQIRQLREQLERVNSDMQVQQSGTSGFSNVGGGMQSGSTDQSGGMQYQDRSQDMPQPEPQDNSGYSWQSGNAAQAQPGQLGSYSQSDSGVTAGSNDAAATMYEAAFAKLKSADYDGAQREFDTFLAQYPNHSLSANATYWLGETYYVRGKFDQAARTFAEGYKKDPKGGKAADNLLKMGMSLAGLNKKPEACVALGQIEKEFSTSAGPVLKRAQQEMTRLGC